MPRYVVERMFPAGLCTSTAQSGPQSLVDRITITGGSPDSAFTLNGSEVDYLARNGAEHLYRHRHDHSRREHAADGPRHVPRRTGAYRGATGTYAFHASIAAGSSVLEGGSTGTPAY